MIRSATIRRNIPGNSGNGSATDAKIFTSVSLPAAPWSEGEYLAAGQRDRLTGMGRTIHRTCEAEGCTARPSGMNAVYCADHGRGHHRSNGEGWG